MKKQTRLVIFSATLAILAMIVGPGMNYVFADHGGDNGNSGRGDSHARIISSPAPVSVVSASAPASSTSTGTVITSKKHGGDDENENENENEHNNNNAALEARIKALETQVAEQEARILALEKKVGIVDVVAPVISATTSANIATTSADVTWTTDEPATSKVYFSATTPVNLATATTVSDAALVMSHSLHLTGLTANTTYFFVVESADASNNVSKSAEFSFKTVALDVTAPVISATTAANIAATTADITWTTNESATSKVYFSTTTPVVLATATTVSDAALLTSHSLHLTGLTANTAYFFVVESKDASNNTGTSVEQSFTTLP